MSGRTVRLVDLAPVNSGLVILDRLRASLVSFSEISRIDQLTMDGVGTVADVAYSDLISFRDLGHTARVTLTEGSWRSTIDFSGSADPSLDATGAPEDAFTAEQVEQVSSALNRADAAAIFELSADLSATFHLCLQNRPLATGSHWVSTIHDLETELAGPTWVAAVMALGQGPRVISISDASWNGDVRMGAFQILNVRRAGVAVSHSAVPLADDSFRRLREAAGRTGLPSPLLFADRAQPASDKLDLSSSNAALRQIALGVARCLVWHWLSTTSTIAPTGELELTISGARVVQLSLRPHSTEDIGPDIALYLWASGADDPARIDALEQATSLAISGQTDLTTAAGPALRTARSVYELARRGAIAEALATRRSARDSALAAARKAADAAREAAGKAMERSLVQVAAVVAVVISDRLDAITEKESLALLALVGSLSVIFLAITFWFTLSSASGHYEAELRDLDQYREALAADDIDTIRESAVVKVARRDLKRASIAVLVVYGGLLALVFSAIGSVITLT